MNQPFHPSRQEAGHQGEEPLEGEGGSDCEVVVAAAGDDLNGQWDRCRTAPTWPYTVWTICALACPSSFTTVKGATGCP
jgi:hypothetical protein